AAFGFVTITAAVTGNGTATVTDSARGCSNASHCTARFGDSVTITATAPSGNRLASWSGGTCSGVSNPCTFSAANNETDTANFAKTVTITAAVTGSGTATISDSNPVASCSSVASCVADAGGQIRIT